MIKWIDQPSIVPFLKCIDSEEDATTFKELLPLTEKILDKVDNWAQVDSTICDYNNIKKEKEDVLFPTHGVK